MCIWVWCAILVWIFAHIFSWDYNLLQQSARREIVVIGISLINRDVGSSRFKLNGKQRMTRGADHSVSPFRTGRPIRNFSTPEVRNLRPIVGAHGVDDRGKFAMNEDAS